MNAFLTSAVVALIGVALFLRLLAVPPRERTAAEEDSPATADAKRVLRGFLGAAVGGVLGFVVGFPLATALASRGGPRGEVFLVLWLLFGMLSSAFGGAIGSLPDPKRRPVGRPVGPESAVPRRRGRHAAVLILGSPLAAGLAAAVIAWATAHGSLGIAFPDIAALAFLVLSGAAVVGSIAGCLLSPEKRDRRIAGAFVFGPVSLVAYGLAYWCSAGLLIPWSIRLTAWVTRKTGEFAAWYWP